MQQALLCTVTVFALFARSAKLEAVAIIKCLLVGGTDSRWLFVRVFDWASNVCEDIAGDVLASITAMQWSGPAKGHNAGAPMDDANFNRRQTIRVHYAEPVRAALSRTQVFRSVAGARHFGFMVLCSEGPACVAPAICENRLGFDRSAEFCCNAAFYGIQGLTPGCQLACGPKAKRRLQPG